MIHLALMLLQESGGGNIAVQIGGGVLLAGNTLMLIKLSLAAGRYVEKVDQLERRVDSLESDKGCMADDCAVRHPRRAEQHGD